MHIITFTINGNTATVSDEQQVTKMLSVGDTVLYETPEGVSLYIELKSADWQKKREKDDDDWSAFEQ